MVCALVGYAATLAAATYRSDMVTTQFRLSTWLARRPLHRISASTPEFSVHQGGPYFAVSTKSRSLGSLH